MTYELEAFNAIIGQMVQREVQYQILYQQFEKLNQEFLKEDAEDEEVFKQYQNSLTGMKSDAYVFYIYAKKARMQRSMLLHNIMEMMKPLLAPIPINIAPMDYKKIKEELDKVKVE